MPKKLAFSTPLGPPSARKRGMPEPWQGEKLLKTPFLQFGTAFAFAKAKPARHSRLSYVYPPRSDTMAFTEQDLKNQQQEIARLKQQVARLQQQIALLQQQIARLQQQD